MSEVEDESPFDDIPNEIYECIFKYLDAKDLVNCSLVASHWRKMANNNKLWRHICRKKGWKDVNSLSRIESSFINKAYRFNIPDFRLNNKTEVERVVDKDALAVNNRTKADVALKTIKHVENENELIVHNDKDTSSDLKTINFEGNDNELIDIKSEFLVDNCNNEDITSSIIKGISNINLDADMEIIDNYDYSDEKFNPTCKWKKLYLQRKFLSYNWHRGRYVTHWIGNSNVRAPETLTYASDNPYDTWLFLPVIEIRNKKYELSLIKLDGIPRFFCRLECGTIEVNVVCASSDLVVYIHENLLKISRMSQDNRKFITVRSHDIIPDNPSEPLKEMLNSNPGRFYFIQMNSKYIVAGDKFFFFHILCRKTLEKLSLVVCPNENSVLSYTYLYYDVIFYATENKSTKAHYLYEYSITDGKLKQISKLRHPVRKLMANDDFLIIVVSKDVNENNIIIFKRDMEFTDSESKTILLQNTGENWAAKEPQVLLHDDLLFYLVGYSIKIIKLDSRFKDLTIQSEFRVASTVHLIKIAPENLLIIQARTDVEVWDWEKGIKLYTPGVDFDALHATLIYDCTKLVIFHEFKGEACVIGFW